jgi:hypothetical protein
MTLCRSTDLETSGARGPYAGRCLNDDGFCGNGNELGKMLVNGSAQCLSRGDVKS